MYKRQVQWYGNNQEQPNGYYRPGWMESQSGAIRYKRTRKYYFQEKARRKGVTTPYDNTVSGVTVHREDLLCWGFDLVTESEHLPFSVTTYLKQAEGIDWEISSDEEQVSD